MNQKQISKLLDNPKGRQKLAKMMVDPIRKHMELYCLNGLKPFNKYYVLSKNKKLIEYRFNRDGVDFDRIVTLTFKNGEIKEVLLRYNQRIKSGKKIL